MLKVLSNILCYLDPKVKVIGQKAGICDGVPSTSALVTLLRRWPYPRGHMFSYSCVWKKYYCLKPTDLEPCYLVFSIT